MLLHEPDGMRISKTRDSAAAYHFFPLELCHAGAHNKYESFDVWFEANGPELIELNEILDRFVEPSNLSQ